MTPDLFDHLDPSPRLGDITARRHGGASTSEAAFALLAPALADARAAVLAFVRSCGANGATVYDVGEALGKLPSQVSGRLTELCHPDHGALLRDSGRRRLTPSGAKARVLVAAEFVSEILGEREGGG